MCMLILSGILKFLACRTVDEASGVNFDPDSFLSTLQGMLGQGDPRQPASGSDSEGTLSGDDLSVSSDESEAGDVCVGSGDGDDRDARVGGDGGVSGDGGEGGTSISQLMAEMDLELAETEVGKSFEKAQVHTYCIPYESRVP